jgi:hypothetical protein
VRRNGVGAVKAVTQTTSWVQQTQTGGRDALGVDRGNCKYKLLDKALYLLGRPQVCASSQVSCRAHNFDRIPFCLALLEEGINSPQGGMAWCPSIRLSVHSHLYKGGFRPMLWLTPTQESLSMEPLLRHERASRPIAHASFRKS